MLSPTENCYMLVGKLWGDGMQKRTNSGWFILQHSNVKTVYLTGNILEIVLWPIWTQWHMRTFQSLVGYMDKQQYLVRAGTDPIRCSYIQALCTYVISLCSSSLRCRSQKCTVSTCTYQSRRYFYVYHFSWEANLYQMNYLHTIITVFNRQMASPKWPAKYPTIWRHTEDWYWCNMSAMFGQ